MKRAMRRMRKTLVLVACIALVCGLAIGGTVAWLADTTTEVTNTFSPSNIGIELDEKDTDDSTANKERDTANTYQFVPSVDLVKDPQVRVESDVAFYVFIVENKSTNWPVKATYSIDSAWKSVDATKYPGVYYQAISLAQMTNGSWNDYILTGTGTGDYQNGYIEVADDMKNSDMPTSNATLTFEAYAIQQTGFSSVSAAWDEASKLKSTSTN